MSKRVLQAAALVILFVFQAIAAIAEVPHWKIRDIKPGMHGYGKSVFKGDEPERFDVEFLGNLQSGDKTYFIVRVSGGPGNILQAAGVTAGMSGSPIYVNDKLVGALSFAFPFAKDGIGGVTPFESMYAEEQAHAKLPSSGKPAVPQPFFLPVSVGGQTGFMSPIPVFNSAHGQAVYGIDRNTMAAFSYEGASQENHPEEKLIPGSAISVALITGDVVVRATGTVTAVDGDTVYAFGHPFFGDGPVQFSAWRTPILTLVPMLSNSFKLPSSTWVGERAAITYDGAFGIYGTIGGKVETVPLAISFEDRTGRSDSMNVELPYGKYLPLFAGYMTSLLEGRYPGYAQRANLALQGRIVPRDSREIYLEERFPSLDQTDYSTSQMLIMERTHFFGALVKLMQEVPDIKLDRLDIRFKETSPKIFLTERVFLEEKNVVPGGYLSVVVSIAESGDLQKDAARERLMSVVRVAIPKDTLPGSYILSVSSARGFSNQAEPMKPLPSNLAGLVEVLNGEAAQGNRLYFQTTLKEKPASASSDNHAIAKAWSDNPGRWAKVKDPPEDFLTRQAVSQNTLQIPGEGVVDLRAKETELLLQFTVSDSTPKAEVISGFWQRHFGSKKN